MSAPVILRGDMDHDRAKENWKRTTNHYADCACPPWRYNPRYPAPVNDDCELHGIAKEGQVIELFKTNHHTEQEKAA